MYFLFSIIPCILTIANIHLILFHSTALIIRHFYNFGDNVLFSSTPFLPILLT